MASESKSSLWSRVGWWTILGMGIAFAPYALVFLKGDFEVYKYMTTNWLQGKYDIAGLHILHHLRAWQIHAAAAIVFISMGPFQFSPSFRAKFRTIHRVFGYFFVISGLVSSISALAVLIPNTEFGPIAQKFFVLQALLLALFLLVAVKLAREKKFKVHQQYMIRAAATGYSVIADRPSIFILAAAGMSVPMAMEISAVSVPILCLGLAELYIRKVLLEPKVTTSNNGVTYVQTFSTDEAADMKVPILTNGEENQKPLDNTIESFSVTLVDTTRESSILCTP